MIYKLNETPLKTTNNFKINNIEMELDIPSFLKGFNYKINQYDQNKIKISINGKKELVSKIGINADIYYELNIDVLDNVKINNPLILEYNLTDDLISNININVGVNSYVNIIIKCLNSNRAFNYLKQVTNIKKNANATISLINLFNSEVTNLVAMESNIEENGVLDYNYIDLGGNTKISNYYAKLIGNNSINNFNNVYFGNDDNILDMNYYIGCIGKGTKANIMSEGALKDNSKKSYKGTIDFISGCEKSIGEENENCILLSSSAKSKSLPMLLCGEEDVSGAHGVSTGKIDNNKLFYLESKGLSKKESIKLIINANFNKVFKNIKEKDTIIELNNIVESKI